MPKIKLIFKLGSKEKLLLIFLFSFSFAQSFAQTFEVSYSPSVYDDNFTGNVIVYLSKYNQEPKNGAIGVDLFPCFRKSVKNLKAGDSFLIGDDAVSYPKTLSDIERGEYYVQIVWDRNLGGRQISESAGNLFSKSRKIILTKNYSEIIKISATEIVPAKTFTSTQYVKELKVPSVLLSNFQRTPMTVDAAVVLPVEYFTEPNSKFPVLFTIFGYGADYHYFSGSNLPTTPLENIPVIKVFLDGNCKLGHSVYANSDNNGPWGEALVKEFIPILEKSYRCNGARLLTGHSSGGWSSLWLQTHYPKIFAACFASSPDPVNFENFQKINLYSDVNMFYENDLTPRLLSSVAGNIPWMKMKDIFQIENVIYRGEQLNSFNSVFSKKGRDGSPERLCDPITGNIDKSVFANWKKYDIAAFLKENWTSLKNDLDGKVRVAVGNQDNFFLDKSVYALETEMKKLNSNFKFAYYPGDHFTASTPEYRKDGNIFLKEKYLEWLKKYPQK
ncbi:alpha/beta hydrolase-fold protein [Chryseobacterium sp. JJR-5R]|uniref:alpha/beta hydrolase-fold protein n=1 Tax=Chryseobacterium sp. JJR-5R TaxID=3093923 RepID=UPI002A7493C4|nr:alpha/beta hydrolase-fold protein [Chryseobacterium sp. JJR-5R]WPO81944.1 alpha/beta hydrolase-fold protein [Chryseobacterium sp. JJR-5R]